MLPGFNTRKSSFKQDDPPYSTLRAAHLIYTDGVPVSLGNAGNNVLTAAQILAGIIVRECNAGNRTDTLPSAAAIVAAVEGPQVGDIVACEIINGSAAGNTYTIAVPASGSWDANQAAATQAVSQGQSKTLWLRLTNVTPGSEAYVAYF